MAHTIESTTAETVTVNVDGQYHRMPWELLRAAAGQADRSLSAAYSEMLRDAQAHASQHGVVPVGSAEARSRQADREEALRWNAALSDLAQTLTGEPSYLRRVLGFAREYLRKPDGGWPETQGAWRDLQDVCWMPASQYPGGTEARMEAALDVARRHFADAMHPSRRS